MADIPSARAKVNDLEVSADAPVTEQLLNKLGADINDYLDKGFRSLEFTASGSWTAPDDVTDVFLEIIGGGGGAQGGGTSASGGGGSSGTMWRGWRTVVPGNLYTITCGPGGTAGTGSAGPIGGAGGNGGVSTAFGVTCDGGQGGGIETDPLSSLVIGGGGINGAYYARGYKVPGGNGIQAPGPGNAGASNNEANGGLSPSSSVTFATGGGGGAGFANGGNGESNAVTGTAGTKGSGGGGGVGTSPAGGNGYAGGVGCIRIHWYGNAT